MKRPMKCLTAMALLVASAQAHAHRPSDAYVTLIVDGAQLSGQWEIALRDLEVAAGIDANRDGAITWGELHAAQPRIADELMQALHVAGDGRPCVVTVNDLLINDRLEGRFAWFALKGNCPRAPAQVRVDYHFLFSVDPTHRGILVLTGTGQTHTAVLGPGEPQVTLMLGRVSRWREFTDYLVEGIWHIWTGIDHILFLLALLLPGVLLREQGRWQPVPSVSAALWPVLGVVTAFTVAHSITLSLAALDILRLPGRLVESCIAASVFLAALNNLKPLATRRRWVVAFAFGLIHGFGFASALSELGLPQGARLICLVAFNLGVETGQLAVVAAVMPLAYALRGTRLYRSVILPCGSLAVAAIAAVWFWQRAFGP